jgi:hypothetical protein
MIEAQLIGRLGNQMFQYATCRTIAEKLGYSFYINPSTWLGFDLFHVFFGEKKGANLTHRYEEGELRYDPRIMDIKDGTWLEGYFQSEKYFDNDKAREWFKICPPNDKKVDKIMSQYPIDEYCYINLRGTDVKEMGVQKLHIDYYHKAREIVLSQNPNMKFIVITDDEPYGHEYFPDYPVMNNSVRVDFMLLNRAKYLILANSSFAWWAAWLNLDNFVITPHGWLNVNINNWKPMPEDIKVARFIWI